MGYGIIGESTIGSGVEEGLSAIFWPQLASKAICIRRMTVARTRPTGGTPTMQPITQPITQPNMQPTFRGGNTLLALATLVAVAGFAHAGVRLEMPAPKKPRPVQPS